MDRLWLPCTQYTPEKMQLDFLCFLFVNFVCMLFLGYDDVAVGMSLYYDGAPTELL